MPASWLSKCFSWNSPLPQTFKSPLPKTYRLAPCSFIHTLSRFKIPSKDHSLSVGCYSASCIVLGTRTQFHKRTVITAFIMQASFWPSCCPWETVVIVHRTCPWPSEDIWCPRCLTPCPLLRVGAGTLGARTAFKAFLDTPALKDVPAIWHISAR